VRQNGQDSLPAKLAGERDFGGPGTNANAGVAATDDATLSDADQSASDADQTGSDADQTASDVDQADADRDQRASDDDQATADRDHDARPDMSAQDENAYASSQEQREASSAERDETRTERASLSDDRHETSTRRDRLADARDAGSRLRDANAEILEQGVEGPAEAVIEQLRQLRAQAAADRARAATDRLEAASDRRRAASDRAEFARERARLELELRSAHLDSLTGASRRELGQQALAQEIDRARRGDGRFVVAFVDVDRLKEVNDRAGHAAGDLVLQKVVKAIRSRLRSYDPIIRYGGDEFVCGLSKIDVADAAQRFEAIGVAIQADAGVGISVGLAHLGAEDTAAQMIERADVAMLRVKASHARR